MATLINPFEECGRLHNDILDYLITQNTTPTWAEYRGYTIDYVTTFLDQDTPQLRSRLQTQCGQAWNYAFFDDSIGYTLKDILKTRYPWLGPQLPFLERMTNPSDPIPTNYLTDITFDILGSSLSPQEQAPLLAGCSIGDSSLGYWTDVKTNPASPWYPEYHSLANLVETVLVDMLAYWLFYWNGMLSYHASNKIRGEEYQEEEATSIMIFSAVMAGMASGTYLIFE